MMTYVALMAITCFLSWLETKKACTKQISIFTVLIVLCFSLVAGLRRVDVGTDTITYLNVYKLFYYGHYNYALLYDLGILSNLLMFLLTKINAVFFWYLFISEFVTSWFTYCSLRDEKLKKYTWLGVLVFNCLIYSFNLNLIRQCMAMAITLWGYKYVKERNLIKYIFVIALACIIHISGIIGFVVYPIYSLCNISLDEKDGFWSRIVYRYQILNAWFIIFASTIVLWQAENLISKVVAFKDSFQYQMNNIHDYSFAWVPFVFMIAFAFPIIFRYYELGQKNGKYRFYMVVLIVSIVLWQLAGISRETYRISFYLWQLIVIIIPDYISDLSSNSNKRIMIIYYVLLSVAYYYVYYVSGGVNSTYPYAFA